MRNVTDVHELQEIWKELYVETTENQSSTFRQENRIKISFASHSKGKTFLYHH